MSRAHTLTVALTIAPLSLLGGCFMSGTSAGHGVVIGTAGAPSAGELRIFMRGEAPGAAFDEIAIVQAQSMGCEGGRPGILKVLSDEARAVGANGMIEVNINDQYADKDPNCGAFLASATAVRFTAAVSASDDVTTHSAGQKD